MSQYENFTADFGTVRQQDAEIVRDLRREASIAVETLSGTKKALGMSGDREGARLMAGLVKEQQGMVKACSIVLDSWFGEGKHLPVRYYPTELGGEFDRIFGRIELAA